MSTSVRLYRALALVKLMVVLEPRLGGQQQRYLGGSVLTVFVVVVVPAEGHGTGLRDLLVLRRRQGMMVQMVVLVRVAGELVLVVDLHVLHVLWAAAVVSEVVQCGDGLLLVLLQLLLLIVLVEQQLRRRRWRRGAHQIWVHDAGHGRTADDVRRVDLLLWGHGRRWWHESASL